MPTKKGSAMARPGKVTSEIIPQIEHWLQQGLEAKEIARKIGCTIGTLRVRCSHLGISLRRRGNARRNAVGEQRPNATASENRIVQRVVAAVLEELQAREGKRIREAPSVVEAPSVAPHHFSPCNNFKPLNSPHPSRAGNGVQAERFEEIVIMLPEGTAQQLRTRGVAKGISGAMIASTLLQTVVQDNLFEAVLDET
jgi:hypothetical protein